MNPTLRCLVALAFATGSTFAAAQAQPQQPQPQQPQPQPQAQAQPQSPAPRNREVQFSEQPVASTANNGGEGAGTVNPIAQAIAADDGFRESKITVQAVEEGHVLLTGVTTTRQLMDRAIDIARRQAGDGQVVNALTVEEFALVQAPDRPGEAVFQQDMSAGDPRSNPAQQG